MSDDDALPPGFVLPLPRFILQPGTAAVIAAVHVYLGAGHLWRLFGGEVKWEHMWKGLGAMGGAYVFAALASRGLAEARGSLSSRGRRTTLRSEMTGSHTDDRPARPLTERGTAQRFSAVD